MSNLVLGPVIGKLGGGAEPVDMVFPNAASGFTIDLPSGEWGLVFQFPDVTWDSNRIVRLFVNGQSVGHIGGSATPQLSINPSIMVRHQTGTVEVSFEYADGRISDMPVTAFPDPT